VIEFKAKDIAVGDEFTTQADQGEVWFRAEELKPAKNGIIDVLGAVVQANLDTDYVVGDSEWMDLAEDELVIVR